MKKALRILRNAFLGLLALVVLAALAFYIQSERIVNRGYEVDEPSFTVASTPEDVAEGERLATLQDRAAS